MNPQFATIVRSVFKILGGALVAKGWLDADSLDTFIGIMEMGVGGLVAAVGLGWSIWAKRTESAEAKQIAANVIVAQVPIATEMVKAKQQ